MSRVKIEANLSEWQHAFLMTAVSEAIKERRELWAKEVQNGEMRSSEFAAGSAELEEVRKGMRGVLPPE